jgi:trans-2,3-dihydro-3-hydroxyanthranilate isomerase
VLTERVHELAGVFGVALFVPRLPEVRSRVFVPEPVCAEDPATGSAAPAMAGWLAFDQSPIAEPLAFDIVQGTTGLGLSRPQVKFAGTPTETCTQVSAAAYAPSRRVASC